jgi:hypothetical protein
MDCAASDGEHSESKHQHADQSEEHRLGDADPTQNQPIFNPPSIANQFGPSS